MQIPVAENLWSSSMLPEGVLERWFVADGADVDGGQEIAELRIEDAVHRVMAPGRGRLRQSVLRNAIIEPGSVIGEIAANAS